MEDSDKHMEDSDKHKGETLPSLTAAVSPGCMDRWIGKAAGGIEQLYCRIRMDREIGGFREKWLASAESNLYHG